MSGSGSLTASPIRHAPVSRPDHSRLARFQTDRDNAVPAKQTGMICDPVSALVRIPCMICDQTLDQKSSALARKAGYGRPKNRSTGHKVPKPVQDSDTAGPNWSDHIREVRDTQNAAAFAALFNHFAPRVKGFLINSGADPAMAEEWAQDVMATLWNKAHLFDPARASAATWIFTIARNRRIDGLRKQRRPEPEDLPWGPEPQAEAADALALQQETQKLAIALEDLPDKQRDLVKRAYYGDLTHAELAQETGLPLGTIKSRIRLALERLRRAMNRDVI